MKKSCAIFMLFFAHALLGMKKDNTKLTVYAIPGQNGLGSESDYIKDILGASAITVKRVPTPLCYGTPDLGQYNCLKSLAGAVAQNAEDNKKFIFHATSQGTATALNYLARPGVKKPDAVILEAVLGSGNSAIHHTINTALYLVTDVLRNFLSTKGHTLLNKAHNTVNGSINRFKAKDITAFKVIAKCTFAYYWIPYLAKIVFPSYSPSGEQAIKSIADITTDIPIIIAHSINDTQLSYDDACAVYYGLANKRRGENINNVYFIPQNGHGHIQLLDSLGSKNIIQAILQKHELMPKIQDDETIELASYQPAHQRFKAEYDNLLNKEKNHERFFYFIPTATFLSLCYVMRNHIGRLINYFSLYRT